MDDLTETRSFIVFPNPVSETATFDTKQNLFGEISITDQLGREVKSEKLNGEHRIEISVSDLANGMYFYSVVENAQRKMSGKFIVQHN